MKTLSLFFLAIGLVAGDLLDRSYLPPPGAKLAGGSPGAIDTPFDLPKGSPQYTQDSDDTERSGGLGRPTNIPPEFIDHDGVTTVPNDASNYYQNGFPTTTTSYAFTQTTTLAPIDAFSGSVRPMYGINKNGNVPSVYNQNLSGPNYDGTNQRFDTNQNQLVTRPNFPGSTQVYDRPVFNNQFQSGIPDRPVYNTQRQRFPSTSQISENIGNDEEVNIPSRFSSDGTTLPPGYNRQIMQGFDQTSNKQRIPGYQVEPNTIQRYNYSQYNNQQKPFSTTFRPEISYPNLRPNYELNKLAQANKQEFDEPSTFGNQNEGRPTIKQQNYNYKSNDPTELDYQQYYTSSTTRPQNFNTSPIPGVGYTKDYDNDETLRSVSGFNNERNSQRPTVIPGITSNGQDIKNQQYPPSQIGSFDENVFRNDVRPGSEVTSSQQNPSENIANSFSASNIIVPGQAISNYPDLSNQRIPGPITRPERPQADSDRNAVIINYDNVQTPDGYSYSYDTSNGIHADESGITVNGTKAQGSYSYIGDDGKQYSVVYTADENGFQPHGDHLPTAPPIPKAILEALEKNARDEEAGIIDDGSYNEDKYGHKKYQSEKHPNRQLIRDRQQAAERRNKVQFDTDTDTKFLNNGGTDQDDYYNENKYNDFQDSERSSIKNIQKSPPPKYDTKLDSGEISNAEKKQGPKKLLANTKNKNQMNLSIKKPYSANDKNNLGIQKSERTNSDQNAKGDFNINKENIEDDYAFLEDNTEMEKEFDKYLDIKTPKEGNTISSQNKNASLSHRPNAYDIPEAEIKRIPTYKKNDKTDTKDGFRDFKENKINNPHEQHVQRYRPATDSSTENETDDKEKNTPYRPNFNNQPSFEASGANKNEAKLDKKNLSVSNDNILSSQIRPKKPSINSKYNRPITTTSYDNMEDKKIITEYNRNQPITNTKYNKPTSTARYDDYDDTTLKNFEDDERSATPQSQTLQKQRPNVQKTSRFDSEKSNNDYLDGYNEKQEKDKLIPIYSKNRTGTLENNDYGYQYLPPQTKFTQDERVYTALPPFNKNKVTAQVNDGSDSRRLYFEENETRPGSNGGVSGPQDQIPKRGQGLPRPDYATNENVDDNDFKQGGTSKPYFNQERHDIRRPGTKPVTGATRGPYNTYLDFNNLSTVSNINKSPASTHADDEPRIQNNNSPYEIPQGYNEPGKRKYQTMKTAGINNLDATTPMGRIPSTTYRPVYTIGDRPNPTPGVTINDLGQPIVDGQDETFDRTDISAINRPIDFTQNGNRPAASQFSLREGSNLNQVTNDKPNRPTGSLRPSIQRFEQNAPSGFDGDQRKGSFPRFESVDQAGKNEPYNGLHRGQPSYGEDFSGPKQPQRFDPETGYHY